MTEAPTPGFDTLGLPEPLMRALSAVGYESPSPIQAAAIPPLLAGRDLIGTAQTGTGKTAAFALPILARIDVNRAQPQALVLAPTRELAIQVAEAFQRYAVHLPGFHVLPIYGGQAYGSQLSGLRRGAHVVVGTPGRVIDHLERRTLDLSGLATLVLDEADEMLRMGFMEDIEKVFAALPEQRQVVLFSATMPAPIRRIADTRQREPVSVAIETRTATAAGIRQRWWPVSGLHKLDALTRILEAEPFDAMIVFARTKQATEELAERLAARGFAAAAINGDVEQKLRERTIQRLKDGQIDILVATDVAARGLDVERISHVVNYDIPYDAESYVHRIGRTGRAGRTGEAILFVTPRERGMLRVIERVTRQAIEPMGLPSVAAVNDRRIARFMAKIGAALEAGGLESFMSLVERYEAEHAVPMAEIAAALARLAHGNKPLLLEGRDPEPPPVDTAPRRRDAEAGPRRGRPEHAEGERPRPARPRAPRSGDANLRTWRVSVGHNHGVKPGNLVGAIANEAGLDASQIGRIEIEATYSKVDLPADLDADVVAHLANVRVAGQRLKLAPWRELGHAEQAPSGTERDAAPPRRPYVRKDGGHRGKPDHGGGGKPYKRKPPRP